MKITEIERKLLKIQALHSGAKTEGEKKSAIKAKTRILKKIEGFNYPDNSNKYKFSLKNSKNVNIFIDILNRYEIADYKILKKNNTTLVAKVPGLFVDKIIWPEYLATPERLLY